MTTSNTQREAVARIIDPEAYDEVFADDNEEVADLFAEAWEFALAKADAILALFPDSPTLTALNKLIASAALLQANMEGCIKQHHGVDFGEQGMPGWLIDTSRDIEDARALASEQQESET